MKILHTADNHLGGGQVEDGSRAERFLVFRRILNLARTEAVDLILISGDFLEQDRVESSEMREIISLLAKQAQPIFICPGNHDPASALSFYQDKSLWPENVHILIEPQTLVFDNLQLSVTGAGFKNIYNRKGFFKAMDTAVRNKKVNPKYLQLALVHGEILSTDEEGIYNPLYREDIAKSAFDYLALGHIHKPDLDIQEANHTLYAQAGSPQPLDRGETGLHGVCLLEFQDKELIRTSYVQVAKTIYLDYVLELNKVDNTESLVNLISTELNKADLRYRAKYTDEDTPEFTIGWNLYLKGSTASDYQIDENKLITLLSEFNFNIASLKDLSRTSIDFETLEQEESLRATFYKNIKKQIEDAQAHGDRHRVNLLRRALTIGLNSFQAE